MDSYFVPLHYILNIVIIFFLIFLPLEIFAPLFINKIADLLSQNTSIGLFGIPNFKL